MKIFKIVIIFFFTFFISDVYSQEYISIEESLEKIEILQSEKTNQYNANTLSKIEFDICILYSGVFVEYIKQGIDFEESGSIALSKSLEFFGDEQEKVIEFKEEFDNLLIRK